MARGNDWIDSAAWVVQRPDLPWTGEWFEATLGQLAAMTRTCHACPVLRECAQQAERLRVTAGFWAGRYRDANAPDLVLVHDPSALADVELGVRRERRSGRHHRHGRRRRLLRRCLYPAAAA